MNKRGKKSARSSSRAAGKTLRPDNGTAGTLGSFGEQQQFSSRAARRRETTAKLKVRMHQQEVVALLSQIALATTDTDLDLFMNETAMFVARTLDADYAKILELAQGSDALMLRAGFGWKKSMHPGTTTFQSKSSVAGLTLLSKRPIVIRDLRLERKLVGLEHLRVHHVISGISVIIPGSKRPYGVLGVYSKLQKEFTPDDINFLQSVANILALVFDRALAESELRRFQYMADNAAIGISLIDKEGAFKYVNRITYERLGLSKEEYMKRRVVEKATDSSESRFDALFKQIQKRTLDPLETYEKKKDGITALPLEISLTGVTFEGEPYMFAVSQDITERLKARLGREKAERNLQFLAKAGLVLGSSLDYGETFNAVAKLAISHIADWCVVDMQDDSGGLKLVALAHNDPKKIEFARKYRAEYPPSMKDPGGTARAIRTGKAELISVITKEMIESQVREKRVLDLVRIVGIESVMTVPIKTGTKAVGAITFISSDPERHYDKEDLVIAEELAARAALAIENSRLYSTIEEQKNRLDNIIANVPGIVWESWLNQDIELKHANYVSEYVEKMLGYGPRIWQRPGFMKSAIHPDDVARLYAEYAAMINEKRGMVQRFRLMHKNGNALWVESHSSIILDQSGKALGLRGVIMDVSENTELERRKDEFISMASHELKTPVTTLKVFTQILQKQAEAAGGSQIGIYLSKMDSQILRLTDLINDLLDLSKIQSGKITFKEETFIMDDLVSEIVEQMQPTAESHKLVIEGMTLHKVVGDRDRLGQVIINLLSNAIKYSPNAKEVRICLSEEAGNAVVGIEDYGIGISKAELHKIFERFYQVTDGNQKTFPGLGIGLYISDQIMRRHGGKIEVESVKGKRTLFKMLLPLRRGTPSMQPKRERLDQTQ